MFDKLIESEPGGADFKSRRKYFMVSSVCVGVLFATAVVFSIYAADIGLGSSSFELAEILAPVDVAAPEPETPQPQRTQTQASAASSDTPTRAINMSRTDEPTIAPNSISTTRNTYLSRVPNFTIGPDSGPTNGSGRDETGTGPIVPGLNDTRQPIADNKDDTEPPPVKHDPPIIKKLPPQSLGVVNGRAEHLPKPIYPAAAIAVHAQGKVDVQVMIDESGKVISANAVSGHPLLRTSAEQAARNARFSPTLLSKVPVKVTGVIVYNFTR